MPTATAITRRQPSSLPFVPPWLLTFAIVTAAAVATRAQDVPPAPGAAPATIPAAVGGAGVDDADAATVGDLQRLREALGDAYNRGDVDRLLGYLHPDVLVIFPDAEVLQGRDALRRYYDRMLTGPAPVVRTYTADPTVDGRQVRGDVDLSWGRMRDHYVLTDGAAFGLDSRFTATLVRLPDGPRDTGGWVIRSFHSSTDAFDNPVLWGVAKRTALYTALAAAAAGILLGAAVTAIILRRWRRPAAASG